MHQDIKSNSTSSIAKQLDELPSHPLKRTLSDGTRLAQVNYQHTQHSLLSLPRNNMNRQFHSDKHYMSKHYMELTAKDFDLLHAAVLKRINSLLTHGKGKIDSNIHKSISVACDGVPIKKNWLFSLLKSRNSENQTLVNKTLLQKSITYASTPCQGHQYDPKMRPQIPILVNECVKYIKLNGMTSKGLFRVNGSEKRIASLVTAFDSSPRYGQSFNFEGYNVFDVADFLKRYLRSLPEPLLSSELYPYFLRAGDLRPEERTKVLRILLLLLPASHLVLFECILDLLGRISKRSDQNQMTSHNLGRVLAPNIIRTKNPQIATSTQTLEEYERASLILEFMIDNRVEFLLTGAALKPFLCLDAASIKMVSESVESLEIPSLESYSAADHHNLRNVRMASANSGLGKSHQPYSLNKLQENISIPSVSHIPSSTEIKKSDLGKYSIGFPNPEIMSASEPAKLSPSAETSEAEIYPPKRSSSRPSSKGSKDSSSERSSLQVLTPKITVKRSSSLKREVSDNSPVRSNSVKRKTSKKRVVGVESASSPTFVSP